MNDNMLEALGKPTYRMFRFGHEATGLIVATKPFSISELKYAQNLQTMAENADANPDFLDVLLATVYKFLAKRVENIMPYDEFVGWVDDNFISLQAIMHLIGQFQETPEEAGKMISAVTPSK